jgi:excisionase family DNA binding protein
MTKPLPRDAERRLLDYAHLAAYLSISIRAAKQLAADGAIRKVLIGHRVLFDVQDVDAYIERVKRGAA